MAEIPSKYAAHWWTYQFVYHRTPVPWSQFARSTICRCMLAVDVVVLYSISTGQMELALILLYSQCTPFTDPDYCAGLLPMRLSDSRGFLLNISFLTIFLTLMFMAMAGLHGLLRA